MFEDIDKSEDRGAGSAVPGTRFLVYPQSPLLSAYSKPETIWISTPPDQIQPGPSDYRAYVADPIFEKEPYEFPLLPPYEGATHPPAMAGADGHFDSIPVDSRQFIAAHAFACVSRVLDIWESYLGHPIQWHFADTHPRLEIIPSLEWDNAQSGYGYIELGTDHDMDGRGAPFAFNFDVIAHEVGHSILFSECGFPEGGGSGADFRPIHEAMGDLISLFSFLHFDSGMDRLLKHCDGNLLVLNELNRIAELAGDRQIRLACNSRRLSEVTSEVHDQSRPLTGAMFDTLVNTYHRALVSRGLADERLASMDIRDADAGLLERVSEFTTRNFRAQPFLFKSALIEARDDTALVLSRSWSRMTADEFDFRTFSDVLLAAADQHAPHLLRDLEENLIWRELI
jgi:hypothetical protein